MSKISVNLFKNQKVFILYNFEEICLYKTKLYRYQWRSLRFLFLYINSKHKFTNKCKKKSRDFYMNMTYILSINSNV